MNSILRLTKSEFKLLGDLLGPTSDRIGSPVSLDDLLYNWAEFTREVESGYKYTIYEYTSSLNGRDLLEEISPQIPQLIQERVLQHLQTADKRFMEATRKVTVPLSATKVFLLNHWWYRIPKTLNKGLAEDLTAEGIIAD